MLLVFQIVVAVTAVVLAIRLRHPRDRFARVEAGRPRCPRCAYSLAGLEEDAACPECGLTADGRARWFEHERDDRAHAKILAGLGTLGPFGMAVAMVAVIARAGVSEFVFIMFCAAPPFLIGALVPPRRWRRPMAALAVSLAANAGAAAAEVWLAYVAFVARPSDHFDALTLLTFPITGSAAACVGLLVGSLAASVTAVLPRSGQAAQS